MSKTTNLQLFKHDEPLETNENDFDVGEALNDNWDILDTFAEQVDTRLETLENDLDEISTNLDALETNIETLQSSVTSLQTDNETNKQDIQDLQSEQETQNTAIENNTEELELLKNNLPDPITTDQSEEITVQDAMNYYSQLDVSGNSTQDTRSGKNKLYLVDVAETTNAHGITYSVENGVITLNGTSARTHYINFNSSKFDLPAGDYTMSGKELAGSCSGSSGKQLNNEDNSKNLFNGGTMTSTVSNTLENDETGVHLALYIGSTAVFNNYKFEIQLEEGTTATEYEKYGAMPSPDYPSKIKNCKTSINIKVENANKINLEEDDLNTYSYVVSNKSSNDITWVAKNGAYSWLTLKKYLKAGTYYLQRKYEIISGVDNLGQAGMLTVYTGDDKTLIKSIASNKEKDSFIITQDNYYNIHLIASNGTAQGNDITIRFYDLMLSEKDANYIEHREQILTFPLVEGQRLHLGDYLADNGIHHKKQTIVFDGTENIIIAYNDETIDSFRIAINSKYNQMLGYQTDDKCSHFKNLGHTPAWGRQANTFALSSEGYLYIFFEKNKITSETEAKNWIAEQYNNGTPLTAEGTLEEEYVESYTEEQQAVYNELKNLILYKGYNYITCTDETKCKMKLTYRPDNTSKIKSLEERVAALESEATA